MKVKEVIKLLHNNGWYECRSRGSHMQFMHKDKKGLVTVPIHSGDIPKGTLNSILKQADLK